LEFRSDHSRNELREAIRVVQEAWHHQSEANDACQLPGKRIRLPFLLIARIISSQPHQPPSGRHPCFATGCERSLDESGMDNRHIDSFWFQIESQAFKKEDKAALLAA